MKDQQFLIYVLEDNEWYNKLLVHNLELNPDYSVKSFHTAAEMLDAMNDDPDVVTLDYKLPDMDGMEVLKQVVDYNEEIDVIVVSEQDDIETAVGLLKEGAYDYIVKTNDIRERLHNTILNIRKKNELKREISSLKKEVGKKYGFQHTIIGDSPAIKKVFDLIEKAIRTNISVVITGETGTGKEVVSKAIHYNSKRRDQPFVAVNVTAIPSELIESELFGHEKGAFTGAASRRIGKFEEAHGGTLFLDEIGEMDMSLQVKLLRALQEKKVTRVGGNKEIPTECRIIAATNKNLADLVKSGTFREDLYYRLYGLPVQLPPLRERGNDILILARYFMETFSKENQLDIKAFHPDAQKKLLNYPFPGNVRELKSVVELAATMSINDEIMADDILLDANGPLGDIFMEELTLRGYELKIVKTFLEKYDNNRELVAKKLDVGLSTIYRMIKEMEG